MTTGQSCLYFGQVIHRRFAPKQHRLRYSLFQALFDLDDLPRLNSRLSLFSHNRFNIFSFHDRDHCGSESTPRVHVERLLAEAAVQYDGGNILLLCMPRFLGHVFNPISIYFCFTMAGNLAATVYQVNNTFGEQHVYVVPVRRETGRVVQQVCRKMFFVSPFMDMDMSYRFKLLLPGDNIATIVTGSDQAGQPLIFTAFNGHRKDFSDRTLFSAILIYPFMTIGVVIAIHWEAVKLFAKGLRLRPRPVAPIKPSLGHQLNV